MLDDFIWWGVHAPEWQLYLAMFVALVMLLLLLVSIFRGVFRWEKGVITAQTSENVKTVTVEYEETPSHVFAVKSVSAENIQSMSDKTSQEESGIKTDCSANQTSVASVDSPLPA